MTSGFWYDEQAAEEAVQFFPAYLQHIEGEWAGMPLELAPWQNDEIIRPLFGWKRPDGSRRYRTLFLEIPRKNGKSTLAAGLALKLLFADQEQGGQVYSCAVDTDQARIVFRAARQMRDCSADLSEISIAYAKSLFVPRTFSVYKVLSADAYSKHGLNTHGYVFDEFHAQTDRELYDVMHTSIGARRQPLEIIITTAGYDEDSICYELHDYAKDVAAGVIQDDTFLPVIKSAEEALEADEEAWKDPDVWRLANPLLGISPKLEYFEAECRMAEAIAARQNTFKRLHLNIWTEQSVRWLRLATWDACRGPHDDRFRLLQDLRGQPCVVGIDLSSTTDLSAVVLLFHRTDPQVVVPFFFLPRGFEGKRQGLRKRSKSDRVPYDLWSEEGLIDITPGNTIDRRYIRKKIHELAEDYRIEEIGFDPWNADDLTTQLQEDGFELVGVRQGFATMSSPTKELEKLLIDSGVEHYGNKVLRWMAKNVAVKQDPAGNLKPDKEVSKKRIDGIVATIIALQRAMLAPAVSSVYDDRDPRTV